LTVIATLTLPALLGGPGADRVAGTHRQNLVQPVSTTLNSSDARETMLLVSLEDGSVIMQTISSSADICFKSNSASSTTCLTRGAPLLDQSTDAVIGFEMIEDQIELVGQ
jgi:hypothetical protein